MVQILVDDERQELVVVGGLREETGRGEHWGFNVRKGRDLLCPPTAGGGCTFCPSEHVIHGHTDGLL
jgi:hypothetical protein